jgi:hypothetical protein
MAPSSGWYHRNCNYCRPVSVDVVQYSSSAKKNEETRRRICGKILKYAAHSALNEVTYSMSGAVWSADLSLNHANDAVLVLVLIVRLTLLRPSSLPGIGLCANKSESSPPRSSFKADP